MALYKLLPLPTVGQSTHRSGWPYVMRYLRRHAALDSPILLDDYVERTFLFKNHRRHKLVHRKPWIGICHHPPDVPTWYSDERLQNLARKRRWQASFPSLRLLISMDENLTSWIQKNWGKPCVTIKHPTVVPKTRWTIDRFRKNPIKRLVHIGTFLRDTQAIYGLRAPSGFTKSTLIQEGAWVDRVNRVLVQKFGRPLRVGVVEEIGRLSSMAYDQLLTENVVFLKMITSAASNTVVECIARNTPLVVNRTPGVQYYLGAEYPLFYTDVREVASLVTCDRIEAAHRYLTELDKSFLSGASFARRVVDSIRKYAPQSP